jgi:transcriptional regulator with XRE-family HTH domain
MSNYLTIIGQRIREVRKSQSLTQEQLAKSSGLTVLTIKRAEAGEQNLGINTLSQIAGALGTDMVHLVTVGFNMQPLQIGSPLKTKNPAEIENAKSKRNRKPKSQIKPKTENPPEIENSKPEGFQKIEIPLLPPYEEMTNIIKAYGYPEELTEPKKPETGSTPSLENSEKPKPIKIKKW